MITGWEWDETLFAGTAEYYAKGRLPYAPGLAEVLAAALGLDGTGRLLDVGCGPGTLVLLLGHLFAESVGVDPDAGMLAAAERTAAAAGLGSRTRWLRSRAEDLPADVGPVRVATFGGSFHWMDQDLVAAKVRGLLAPGGAFVHVADLKTEDRSVAGLPHPGVPGAAIDALVKDYLGPVRRAGQGTLPQGTPGGEEEALARAGFVMERYIVPAGQPLERQVEDVVAGVLSLSYSAPHLFGARLPDFEADLRALLGEASPSGLFSERLPSTEMRVFRVAPSLRG